MSPTSYRTAPPRVTNCLLYPSSASVSITVKSLHPRDRNKVPDCPELRIAGNQDRPVFDGGCQGETVRERQAGGRLVLGRPENQIDRHGKDAESKPFYVREDLDLLLVSERALRRVDDLSKVDRVHVYLCTRPHRLCKHAGDLLVSCFLLEQLQESVAVEKERGLLLQRESFFRSWRSRSPREGSAGRTPQAARTGSSTGGLR